MAVEHHGSISNWLISLSGESLTFSNLIFSKLLKVDTTQNENSIQGNGKIMANYSFTASLILLHLLQYSYSTFSFVIVDYSYTDHQKRQSREKKGHQKQFSMPKIMWYKNLTTDKWLSNVTDFLQKSKKFTESVEKCFISKKFVGQFILNLQNTNSETQYLSAVNNVKTFIKAKQTQWSKNSTTITAWEEFCLTKVRRSRDLDQKSKL